MASKSMSSMISCITHYRNGMEQMIFLYLGKNLPIPDDCYFAGLTEKQIDEDIEKMDEIMEVCANNRPFDFQQLCCFEKCLHDAVVYLAALSKQ